MSNNILPNHTQHTDDTATTWFLSQNKTKIYISYKRELTSYCSNNMLHNFDTRNAPCGSFWMEFMVKCII
jgi:hypothetical protein